MPNILTSNPDPPAGDEDVTPLVKSLSGIVKDSNWEEAEKSFKEHLKNKYASDYE